MTKVTLTCSIIIVLAAPCLWATTGQEPHPATNLEIPFLERDVMGARWTAMGGAGIAAIDDGSSLTLNPAGLAKIRRIEVLSTIQKQSLDVDATWFGNETSRSLSSTTLRELSVSFPFPTYRGSLVIAGSLSRRNVLDGYTVRQGVNPDDELHYYDGEERSGLLTSWGGGMGLQVSSNAFIGFEAHGFTGDFDETDRWTRWGICSDAVFAWDTDLGGYGATIGMQYEPSSYVGLGAVLKTPQRVSIKGEIEQSEQDCGTGLYRVDDTATLPYSVGVGLAFTPASLLATVDVIYTDWQEIDYPGPTRDLDTLTTHDYTGAYIYGTTADVRLGLEYTVPAFPLRLRAGYARVPLELDWFNVTKDRTSISLGAGAVIESALALDVAWQHTSYKRESAADQYSEERTNNRLLVTLAYRF
jgi:hypothetical protein